MKTITGKFNSAKVFTDNLEATAEQQIQTLCDQAFVVGSSIWIMPDCPAGVIGLRGYAGRSAIRL